MSPFYTRADVYVSEPKHSGIPGLIRTSLINVTVLGRRFEVRSQRSWLLGNATEIRVAQQPLVEQKSDDLEEAIRALLDVLNTQAPSH